MNIVIFGLAITSSWGNGHAVTYRALTKALAARGHGVTFLERDVPWYRDNRDISCADYCRIELYDNLKEIPARFGHLVTNADLVVLGSFVPQGAILGDWITSKARGITSFYDIDTPHTLAALELGSIDYLNAALIPRFDLYLSFTGGPILSTLEQLYCSPCARPLYCTAEFSQTPTFRDPSPCWEVGYLGTYSKDRQAAIDRLLLEPARQLPDDQFAVAGAQYPSDIRWPGNVTRVEHSPPQEHCTFYRRQRYTLNVTRADMIAAGFSPSVRLFEAAACGVPVITDRWAGLDTFFMPGKEILFAESARDVLRILEEMPDDRRRTIAAAAHKRFHGNHTPAHRARQLEDYYGEVIAGRSAKPAAAARRVNRRSTSRVDTQPIR